MCLKLLYENRDFFITEEDIICYKILINSEDGLMSLYYRYKYKLNKLVKSVMVRRQYSGMTSFPYMVKEGLHSFIRKEHALLMMKHILRDGINYKLTQAVIPKGSKVYKGNFGTYGSYASDQLIITEILSEDSF